MGAPPRPPSAPDAAAATPKAGSVSASRGTWGRRARRRPSCFKESEDTRQDKSKDTSATTANDGKRKFMHVHTHTHTHTTPDTLTPHTQRWKRECAGKIHTTHTHTHTHTTLETGVRRYT